MHWSYNPEQSPPYRATMSGTDSATACATSSAIEKHLANYSGMETNKLHSKSHMDVATAVDIFKAAVKSYLEKNGKAGLSEHEAQMVCELFQSTISGCFCQFVPESHPLTTENPNRFVSSPIVHEALWMKYNQAVASFWTVSEINMSEDPIHWNEKLNEDERRFVSHLLAFFSCFDGVVIQNLVCRILAYSQIPEARSFYSIQVAVEAIHSQMYAHLINTLIPEEEEKSKLFNACKHFPMIKKKEEWAKKWMESDKADLAEIIVAFAVVEGIFFSGAFAAIFWLKKRGIMPGLTHSNELISRDEGLHRDFACLLFKEGLVNRPSRSAVLEIVTEAVEIEKDFLTEALPVNLIGMNCSLMKEYIEFVADKLLDELDMEKHYNTKNPFDFMENISLEIKSSFLERDNSDYQRANVMSTYDWGPLW